MSPPPAEPSARSTSSSVTPERERCCRPSRRRRRRRRQCSSTPSFLTARTCSCRRAGSSNSSTHYPMSEGLLPPWHEWWPAEALEQLLPDELLRRQVVTEIPRVPGRSTTSPCRSPRNGGHDRRLRAAEPRLRRRSKSGGAVGLADPSADRTPSRSRLSPRRNRQDGDRSRRRCPQARLDLIRRTPGLRTSLTVDSGRVLRTAVRRRCLPPGPRHRCTSAGSTSAPQRSQTASSQQAESPPVSVMTTVCPP